VRKEALGMEKDLQLKLEEGHKVMPNWMACKVVQSWQKRLYREVALPLMQMEIQVLLQSWSLVELKELEEQQ
jgi:hypothetical protein